jgi:8-oxo-dGTP pyrophosphatase MutT (NUDIX family)
MPALEGSWDENISWRFYLSNELPLRRLCTAVVCLAILDDTIPEKVVLGRSERGWEMLGGHVDPGETVEYALEREAIEEGGFHPTDYRPFGYYEVTAKLPMADDHHGGTYPQVAYIPHFVSTTSQPLVEAKGEEILESGVFSVDDELPPLEATQEAILRLGLTAFRGESVSKG